MPRAEASRLSRPAAESPAHFALTRTKLTPPRLPPKTVAFDRHGQWLDPILEHSLCLVRAPSGYGKSTICTGWHHALSRLGIDTGWVSFEKQDDDPARAIPYIFEAVRGVGVEHGLVYDGLTPPQSLATQFVNAFHDAGNPFVLFLDDLDKLTDPRILQFLNFILLHCPDNLHIVCACQAYPALPLVFLDTHAMMLRVGIEELRLNDEEAGALLGSGGNALAIGEARKLNAAMAGWVTGLRIGSAALRNNRDALLDIGLVSQGAHWLSDYLEENIFQHLTPNTRQFLMRCAIVETMTADLCTALSGDATAPKQLAWLADQNLFIQRLDDAGTRFRIHPVFREFLLARLAREGDGQIPRLHETASHWFADHGQMTDAIGHALDAGETEQAATLINQAAMAMVVHSDIVALLGWIARLPAEAVASHLQLRLAEAWALTLTLRPQARTLMNELSQQVKESASPEIAASLQRELLGIETIFLAVYEDRLDAALAYGHRFLAVESDENSFVTRAVRNATAYCELQRGNTHLVHDLVRPSQLQAMRSEQLFTTAYRYSIVGLNYVAQGELGEAERSFQAGLDMSERLSGRQSASSALVAAFLSRSLYERGEIDRATALIEDRLPILDEAAFHEAVMDAYVVMIRAAAIGGQIDRAAALLEHAELIGHERNWRRLLATCALERTRLRLPLTTDLGNLSGERMKRPARHDLLNLDLRTHAIVTKARCLDAIFRHDVARAQEALDWLKEFAALANSAPLTLKIELMAVAASAIREPDFALDPDMASRLGAALHKGFGRTILDGLVPLSGMSLARQLAPVEGAHRLLESQAHLAARAPFESKGANRTVYAILTSREIDVLTGVGRGDSNKEIARRLHLTPETVKWHLKNVMRKMGADTRAEAVSKASILGLSLSQCE